MRIVRKQRVVPWFVGTRLVMLLLALDVLRYFNRGAILGDVQLYDKWVQLSFRHGEFPLHDHKWQYPPGAAVPLLLPKLFSNAVLPGSYYVAFFLLCLAADAVVFTLLLRMAARPARVGTGPARPGAAGPWLWTIGIAAIGPMAYGRYDLVVTACAVGALAVLARLAAGPAADPAGDPNPNPATDPNPTTDRTADRPLAAAGLLIGFGAFIKLWPAALLFGAPRGRRGRILVGVAALSAAIPTLVLQLMFPGVLSFLTNQKSRGIQIESVFATPFLVGRWFGWTGRIENTEYGAYEYLGPGVAAAAKAALLANVIGFAVVLWLRRRAVRAHGPAGFPLTRLPDVALAATLVAVVTSRVLSPQYLVWILGLAAVCLTRRDTLLRVPAWIVLGAVSVTQLIFPLFYHSLRGGQIHPGLILLGRNGALVVAAVLAVRALWRATAASATATATPSATPASAATAASGLRLGQDVLLPAGDEVGLADAEHAPEGRVDRIG